MNNFGNSEHLLDKIEYLQNRVELLENILKLNNIDSTTETIKKRKQLDKMMD
tara:strand:+ start:34 stop:189 length:156 start_codon:yes stop_codon:yes gene_type:complete